MASSVVVLSGRGYGNGRMWKSDASDVVGKEAVAGIELMVTVVNVSFSGTSSMADGKGMVVGNGNLENSSSGAGVARPSEVEVGITAVPFSGPSSIADGKGIAGQGRMENAGSVGPTIPVETSIGVSSDVTGNGKGKMWTSGSTDEVGTRLVVSISRGSIVGSGSGKGKILNSGPDDGDIIVGTEETKSEAEGRGRMRVVEADTNTDVAIDEIIALGESLVVVRPCVSVSVSGIGVLFSVVVVLKSSLSSLEPQSPKKSPTPLNKSSKMSSS
jgi:hypothetical protein